MGNQSNGNISHSHGQHNIVFTTSSNIFIKLTPGQNVYLYNMKQAIESVNTNMHVHAL